MTAFHDIFHGVIHGTAHNRLVYGTPAIVAPTPTHQATGAKAEGTGNVTVNWPAHQADDVALLFIETSATEAAVLGTPAGFVEVTGSPQFDDASGGGNHTRLTAYWCRATSGAMASPVITDPGNHCEAIIVTYRGCRTFDVPYSAVAGDDTDAVTSAAVTVPSAETDAPNCRIVLAIANGAAWDASGYTNANLTGITERFDDYTGAGNAGQLAIADGEFEGPGDWGPTTATLAGSSNQARMAIALTGSSGGGSVSAPATLTALGTPITAARIWTTGLSDDGYFIMQAHNYGITDAPVEWFVFNLNDETYETYLGPAAIFANSNYKISSTTSGVSDATGGNQVRASNGRIFFPCRGLNVAYYDPTDHEMHFLPAIVDAGFAHAAVFRLEFGNDGLIYGTTQADSGTSTRPVVFTLDPDTLETEIIGRVGTLPNALLYGYYLAVEDGGTHVYVAVGQNPWELWSLDTATGISTKLDAPGFAGPYTHLEFQLRTEGWSCRFAAGETNQEFWVADGVLYAGAPTHDPLDFDARDVTGDGPAALVDALDINWTEAGQGNLQWRERGEPSYADLAFDITTAPIPLNGLTDLTGGDTLVVGEQYSGFARYDGSFTSLLSYIISQPVFTEAGEWFTGYPNGVLYHYEQGDAWNPGVNPELVGDFSGNGLLSDIKYGYFLQLCPENDRLYTSGRRERSGVGTGIGYYDTVGETFEGHHDSPLGEYNPRGMVVLGSEDMVVVSGEKIDGSEAKLLIYDLDLVLQDELTVLGDSNTGLVFSVAGDVIVGITPTGAYKYDIGTETVLSSIAFGLTVTAVTQHADGRLLIAAGNKLLLLDPTTMEFEVVVSGITLDYPITQLNWIGDTMLAIAGPTLYEVT